ILCGPRKAIWAATLEHVQRAKQANPYLVKTRSPAEVGLVYSERTANLEDYNPAGNCGGPYFSNQFGLYAALAHAHIQCDPIYADGLKAETLKRYKVLVLSDAGCLEPETLVRLREWVAAGGYLIATGGSARLDQWGRGQKDYQLADVFGVKYLQTKKAKGNLEFGKDGAGVLCKADAYEVVAPTTGLVKAQWATKEPAVVLNRFGKGSCLFVSAAHPGLSLTASGMAIRTPFARDLTFFKGLKEFLAASVQEGLAATQAALPFVVANCPEDVEVTMRVQAQPQRRMLHFVNHSLTNVPVKGTEVTVNLAPGQTVKEVYYACPEKRSVPHKQDGNRLTFKVRDFEVYELVVVEPGN
ncbi:MAG: beta-galactosidase trimerization domain-containing protein, partial [Verrucomicrobiae bacterium]|nr:beta-galactosidase trimerization domain-containing protein [Verrucomicrobiae bacterium]